MRKLLLPLLIALAGLPFAASAAPGDTTWVQATNRRFDNGSGYGNYDTTVQFPSGTASYRKIYMVFTMGEYPCPAGAQYCHQWDYDLHSIIMTPAGDTFELGRLISPYANTGVPRFPATWTHRYIFDVTDYYPILKNSATFRVFYSGYSAGFTGNVRFAFVEGTPERNVLGITRLWHGGFQYGNAADPIDGRITARNLTAPTGTQSAEMKVIITGHGSDANGCCEFDKHYYQIKVNGNQVNQTDIWRDKCGLNQLYPQGGTWIYDRANWCPGELIEVNTHVLTGVTGGSPYSVDMDFEPYSVGSNFGSYSIEGAVFYYGAMNHTADASLEDIIAPTNFEGHFRENPSGGQPTVRVHNSGSTPITTLGFVYGVKDSAMSQYVWNGTLAPRKDTLITLPALPSLAKMSLNAAPGVYQFITRLTHPAPTTDNDPTNDTLTSYFTVAPTWPTRFVLSMKTNNEGVSGLNQNPSETSWQITDMSNNVVASRTNASINTQYNDTVDLGTNGFYRLTINDGGCDGLSWWVYQQNPSIGVTSGSFFVKRIGNPTNIVMNGYSYAGTFAHDFGCTFSQYFTTAGWATGVPQTTGTAAASLEAYPNPARQAVTVRIDGLSQVAGTLRILDAAGRTVLTRACSAAQTDLDVNTLTNGIYQVVFLDETGRTPRLQTKLVIAR